MCMITREHTLEEIPMSQHEEAINKILDNFDFAKVRVTMIATKWKWVDEVSSDGRRYTESMPTLEKMKDTARSLLEDVAKDAEDTNFCSTGGFLAAKTGEELHLWFV